MTVKKDKEKQVADKIIEISKGRLIRSVSNKEIYFIVTKKKKFSKKAWYELRKILVKLLDMKYSGLCFYGWEPMGASKYIFPYVFNSNKNVFEIDERKNIVAIRNWCAGFSLHKSIGKNSS